MEELVGWIGNALLSITGPALALECIFKGKTSVREIGFLWIWFVGEIFAWSYVIIKNYPGAEPLHFNYGMNTISVAIVIAYYYKDFQDVK